MRPLRTTLYAVLATAGLAGALALVNAASQEPAGRQHATDRSPAEPSRAAALSAPALSAALLSTGNPPSAETTSHGSPARGNALWAIPLSSLTATQERPIFSASRRPPVVVELAAIEPKPVVAPRRRPALSLLGAIAGETEGIGIFLDEASKRVIRLKTGESYAGWTLRSVTSREATLQRGRESAVFSLPNPPAK